MFKIGTLVRWTGRSKDYGCLGLVSKNEGEIFWVIWADGDLEFYRNENIHGERLEVLCE